MKTALFFLQESISLWLLSILVAISFIAPWLNRQFGGSFGISDRQDLFWTALILGIINALTWPQIKAGSSRRQKRIMFWLALPIYFATIYIGGYIGLQVFHR